ncbi:MAG: M23 family metallopeptidase [Campylobacter sp.]|nr:M23 family metallopeptidase [Campylobacter sp.]
MRIFILFFLALLAFGNEKIELVKGQALLLELDKKDLLEVKSKGKKLVFFTDPKNKDKVIALFALPYKNPPKTSQITAIYKNKNQNFIIYALEGNYTSEKLQVEPKKLFPPKSVQDRIERELKEANAVYSSITKELLVNENFKIPLDSFITSAFGKARVFNEQVASYHSGTDFRAPTGTIIKAANSGIVRIAKDRYYAGNSVVIDHGYGIYSQYYHLSEIKVKVGQRVKRGDIVGLSGATGRVSGPHLHFGIFAGGKQVDPLDFVAKFNQFFQ